MSELVLRSFVERHAPHAAAILAPGRTPLTYGRLRRAMDETVAVLNGLGIGRGDRVAMVLQEGPEMAVAFLGIASAASCVPLNPAYRAAEFEAYFSQLDCAALVVLAGTDSAAVPAAQARGIPILELMPQVAAEAGLFTLHGSGSSPVATGLAAPSDVALLLFTSGTSSRPKLVPLTHRNLCASAESIRSAVELSAGDRCLNVMPLFHIHGLSALIATLAAGGSVVCSERFSALHFFEGVEAFHPTWYTAAPTIHREILEHAERHPGLAERASLRFIRSASAPMPPQLLADMERAFRAPFVEAYGMTEAAPQIASNRLAAAERRTGSVGRAAGPDVAIMDQSGGLMAADQDGEIVIRGASVMRAYEDDLDANRAAFSNGWLRTGDRGRLDGDGFLFVTGRLKEIINRGGEKISPREVDEVLLEHPAVSQAVTFPVPHPTLGEDIAAAIVLRPDAPAGDAVLPELRRFAASRLAHFKVPQQVLFVDRIPNGDTAKVQRLRLAERLGLNGRRETVAPRTALEAQLAEVWQAVLGTKPGIHDNFFQLGGDSLRAAQVISRLGQLLELELPPHTLFEYPTIAELAQLVEQSERTRTRIPRRSESGPAPLSSAQQRLWFLDQVEPGNPAYNMHSSLRLSGRLDVAALERSLTEIVRRHESLRTTFRAVEGRPVQLVQPAQPIRLAVTDLGRLPDADREAEALRLAVEEAGRPFHLARGPVFRAMLLRLGAEDHVLLLTTHHIASDAWSAGVLTGELERLYGAFAAGKPSPLSEPAIQYADYAAWQRSRLESGALASQLEYWTGKLSGTPQVLELPGDHARPVQPSYRGARYSAALSPELTAGINALSRREGATPFMTVLTAFQALLHRYTGQTDFAVGTPVAHRSPAETEGLIGFFANTLVLRADCSGNPSFPEALGRVRRTTVEALAHQDLPFERLVDALDTERTPQHNPLFQVMFAFQNVPQSDGAWPGLGVRTMEVPRDVSKFDLTLYVTESGDQLTTAWQYSTDLFEEPRIARMAGHFQALLEGIVGTPEVPVAQLPLSSAAEQQAQLAGWNQTDAPYRADVCFHQLFEEQVDRTPDAAAVLCGETRLTYRELDRRANRLATRLREMGVGPETRVGILLHRSTDMVAAVLGVLKSGGAFVPVDPAYPAAHRAFMLDDAGVSVLITETALRPGGVPHVLCVDDPFEAGSSDLRPAAVATPKHLAYVIYTSGSTGKPKGVMITHANLSHYVQAMGAVLGVTPNDRWLHTASLAFSSSVRQIAVPLASGAGVAIAAAETVRNPHDLFGQIRRQGVTILDLVPTYWRAAGQTLADLPAAACEALLDNRLRLLLSASEPLPADVAADWAALYQGRARFLNMFGQTETTGIVTLQPVPAHGGGVAPIGKPLPNTRCHVLDGHLRPVPVGAWGELYVGGAGVGRGYLDEPALTAERFVADPFRTGERLYRTGDVVRWSPDGVLEYSGRGDQQLKVQGHRIEPAQIEACIGQHNGWREAAVLTRDDEAGNRMLVAYVAPVSGEQGGTRGLREYLRQRLPAWMVPVRIVALEALPRTPNGKIDRAALGALPMPETETPAPARAGLAAETLTRIWSEVLALPAINPDDNFFDLGGNSILSIRMIHLANQAGLRLTPKLLWQHPTIAELAPVAGGVASVTAVEPQDVRVTVESLRAYGREALERAGLLAEGAAIVTEVQLEASLRDQPTHNMVSIPRYAKRIANGTINPRPDIRVERTGATSARVDGDNGPGQWVAVVAMEEAIRIAREHGMGVVGVRGSNHLGAAGHYPWLAAQQGLIGLCTTNGPVILAPTGGITPTYGNNPIAVGIPAKNHLPILLDIAMSVAPRGRIGLQLAEGKPLPPGWILDKEGRPSTDPADLVAGLGVPIGGHKGYGLTLVMEVLAGVLTGANFGWDNRREHNPQMVKPAGFGHFFLAIDPEMFQPLDEFTARVDRLIEQTRSGEKAAGSEEILVPGERELKARERSLVDGVPLRASTYQALLKYARAAGLATQLEVLHTNW